jgi:hypothetical protein
VRRVLLWSLAVVIIVAGVGWGVAALHEHATYGRKIAEDERTVTVGRDDRFSLSVPDRGASVGDSWSATVSPPGILTAAGNRKVMSNLWDRVFGPEAGGGGGTRYVTFTADRPGSVQVTLSNCFQGCRDTYSQRLSRTVTWSITVG